MKIKFFEEIDYIQLGDWYSKELNVGLEDIEVELNFDSESIDIQQVEKLNYCLNNLKSILDKSWNWVLEDYKNKESVINFISFHLEDSSKEYVEEILKGTDSSLNDEERFLQVLKAENISIYPESPKHYIVVDWMINSELSNEILVVNINEELDLEYITIES